MSKGSIEICLAEADAFYDVALSLMPKVRMFLVGNFIYPCVVNYAFCCELYLKTLMILRSEDHQFVKGHYLKVLFEHLDEKDQESIRNLYKPDFKLFTFDGALEEFNRAFEDWRYVFEDKEEEYTITIFEFAEFARILKDYVNCEVDGQTAIQ